MKVRIDVTRRSEIADPQGTTVRRALHDLGHETVTEVRVDRVIHLDVDDDDPARVGATVEEMCRQLLTNPVLEDFSFEVIG